MAKHLVLLPALIALASPLAAEGVTRPWIAATYFYWYTWDYKAQFGGWVGGVYNTPLYGYYHSPSYRDNLRSLRVASEWGLTDFFMDYWGPGWKGDEGEPREQTVLRAAEELQRRGYDMHMGFYQDGEDFDMAQFEKNLDPGRAFRFYVENWGNSPVLPRIGTQPVHLVYSRNGAPKPTRDDEGFRTWLRGQYPSLEALNASWGTDLASWDRVKLDFSTGGQRADSIRYATNVWKTQWDRTQRRAIEELHVSPPRVSFDVAYQPFLGWGYSPLAKSLGGPHSYAGIFGRPEDQDLERFIQAAVSKAYGTVFFDHFKNYYHDVEIRTPGTIYPPDFCAFDRFWAGALARYSEAMLHLSWNEWWEGSNLEPCWEFDKTYCEKNLLWATIMKQCFGSLHEWNRGAKVAVLLNDWLWLSGARYTDDVYGCIQALRRSNVTFDLLPDDFVTRDRLADIELVVAPTGSAGLGVNANGQPIAEVLKEWIDQPRQVGRGPTRRLVVSQLPAYLDWLGIKRARPARAEGEKGPDLNVFVDVGEEGDERFLVSGATFRENWGEIPKDAFGATDRRLTCRWTPGTGLTTIFVLPCSPYRDHVFRVQGSGFRPNRATLVVGEKPVGTFDIKEGMSEYEVRVPASAIGPLKVAEVKLIYEKANVPMEIDPKTYPVEARVCNLAIDWVQWSTDNIAAHTTKEEYSFPQERVVFGPDAPGRLAGRSLDVAWLPREALDVPEGSVRGRYASDGAPHGVVVRRGENEVWYVNGLAGAADGRLIPSLVTDWAGLRPKWRLEGEDVLGTLLQPGENTYIAVVYNHDIRERPFIKLSVPTGGRHLVEAIALSRDGETMTRLGPELAIESGQLVIKDQIRYYAAYEIAFGPVAIDMPSLSVTAGATRRFEVALNNRERRATTVRLGVVSPVPTITAHPVEVLLNDYEDKTVSLEVACSPEADWGQKTIVLDLSTSGQHTYLWRRLTVRPEPEPGITTTVVQQAQPELTIANAPHPLSRVGPAEHVRVRIGERQTQLGELESGGTATCRIEVPPATDRPALATRLAELSWISGDQPRKEKVQPVRVATYPRTYRPVSGGVAPILVFNGAEKPVVDTVVSIPPGRLGRLARGSASRLYVRDDAGSAVPSQLSADRRELLFLASVPALDGRTYYACLGEPPSVPTELAVRSEALGSGHGRVTIGNQALEIVLDEQAGATATSLRSLATNSEYGARSFGAARGTWGRFDPLSPATSSTELLKGIERKSQWESPGKLTLIESGPVRTVVRAQWHGPAISATQTYSIFCRAPFVRVECSASIPAELKTAEELVVFDGRLSRAKLTKIFPDFVGITESFDQSIIQHGWRMATHVPDYFTCMTPNDFPESISFVLLERSGLNAIRQGFWPAERGKNGPCALAWVELLAHGLSGSATVDVMIHKGHQPVAAEHLASVQKPPLVIVPAGFKWLKEPA
jgi:hypothetical protein